MNEEGSEGHRMAIHDCNSLRILIIMYTSVATDTHICNTIGRFNHQTPTPTTPLLIVFKLSIITFLLLSHLTNNMLKTSPNTKIPVMERMRKHKLIFKLLLLFHLLLMAHHSVSIHAIQL